MKKIEPYQQVEEALLSLDNGGRFYNIFTKADDGEITGAEISKVAGVFGEGQKTALFLHAAISALDASAKDRIFASLDKDLQADVEKYRPLELLPSEALLKAPPSASAIITGYLTHVEARSERMGFVLIPVMVGKIMTLIPVPLTDQYDVYEMRDEQTSDTFLIAHSKGEARMPQKKLTVAGIIKEINKDKKNTAAGETFLEAHYYMDLF